MSKYDKLQQRNQEQIIKEKEQINIACQGLQEIVDDVERTVEIYDNASGVLDNIDKRFEDATKLNKIDVSILMAATALQIGRWIVIALLNDAVTNKISPDSRLDHNDKSIQKMERDKRAKYKDTHSDNAHIKESKHRDWANIVFNGVPYDSTRECGKFNVNMGGGMHRIHTLGHDPILGWIFGTMNILSDTITLENFETYKVGMNMPHHPWTEMSSLWYGFETAFESIQEDINRLPAAIFAQALHYKSDVFTKQGLPLPVLEVFAPDFAGKLYKEGYDTLCLAKDIAVIGIQAVTSIFINLIITLIHGLFYDSQQYPSRDIYEVKTRKILLISNCIATSSNILWVSGNVIAGNEAEIKHLDIGGIVITMHRLISDTKFINQVKYEFLEQEWYNTVMGEEYKFVNEV